MNINKILAPQGALDADMTKMPVNPVPDGTNIPQTPTGIENSGKHNKISKLEEIENYISNIVEFGMITKEQGDFIRQSLINKMDNGNINAEIPDMIDFDNLNENDFKFFESRKDLREYLQNAGVKLDRGEFEKIEALVHTLETEAVQRFQQICQQGENLKQLNDAAKERLKTASSKPFSRGVDVVKRFSPAEIGKMSSAEFLKNEALINQQLREGKFN